MTAQANAPDLSRPPALVRLLGTPRPDRRAVLAELVSQEFKRVLLMRADDELPLDENYFDLGLTSLKAAEAREHLETDLGCEMETSVLFSCSTVRQVVEHLADVILSDGASGSAADARKPVRGAEPAAEQRVLVDALLRDLYDN